MKCLEFGILKVSKMENKEFSHKLEYRTRKLALSIIKLSCSLPDYPEGRVIRSQITKSGTSIGANYREANRARSRADFTNKIKICESEANETIYWIEIIQGLQWADKQSIDLIMSQANELLAIFTSIGKNLKS